MNIDITNLQTVADIDTGALTRFALRIMGHVAELDPSFHWRELSIVLTDDSIRALNREWFGKDRVTDVISFAYPDDGLGDGDTGEVILNVRQALEEGQLRESPDTELALYLAHGCHHLTGAEDNTPDRKRAMLALETAWVDRARNEQTLEPFFR